MKNNKAFLAFESQLLMAVDELPIRGKHDQANALAALAIGAGFGLSIEPMLTVLRQFKGLPHRCQLIAEFEAIRWYNDSKGTNVGATLAAIAGLGEVISGKLVLILGGVGKNADFSALLPVIKKHARHVVLMGEAAPELATLLKGYVPFTEVKTMDEAIHQATLKACPNDCVLLSPACASFDMFRNYEHRGDVFTALVNQMIKRSIDV